ncbi:TPA: hypothetical protein ACOECQ_002782 [Stenotrophomonas maltophilia]
MNAANLIDALLARPQARWFRDTASGGSALATGVVVAPQELQTLQAALAARQPAGRAEQAYNAVGVSMTACQLREALLMAGDPELDVPFEDRSLVRIFWTESGHSGPGLYCECVDAEEDGCIVLDGTSPAIVPRSQAAGLWCLHVLGMDDVHPAPSKAHAEKAAAWHNEQFKDQAARLGISIEAKVVPWPHSAESHAAGVADFIPQWLIPRWQLDALEAKDAGPTQAVDLPYSLDADPAGIRARVADVITGTLMVGAQGHTPPPAGHWAEPFWKAARADATAQALDLGQMPHGIRLVEIPRRNGLDPINVFVQDYELGRGRIVVTCYGQAWCGFWGAMGDRTVMQFVASCDADYVAGNMLSGRHEHVKKHERTYVERIATEVIAEFRALIGSQAVGK